MNKYMLQLKNVKKQFAQHTAVKNLNLDIQTGEFLTLLGPSGCGKTTTLRMIAGFEKPTSGEIWIGGEMVNQKEPYKREVNTVFQSYSLFPHMNVFDNVAFGLRMKKTPKKEIAHRVMEALRMVQLEKYADRSSKKLSGGQQQRIAIARAIVNNPKVLLLDEPLGALDLKLRKQMQIELKRLQQSLGITFVYVTHDQEEALTMSDRIVVMSEGKIEQIGLPEEIYEKPVSRFVADFIGETNLFEGTVTGLNGHYAHLDIGGQNILIPKKDSLKADMTVHLSIRPEKATIATEKCEDQAFVLSGKLKDKIYIGTSTKMVITLQNGQEMVVSIGNIGGIEPEENKDLYVSWKPEDSVVFQTTA